MKKRLLAGITILFILLTVLYLGDIFLRAFLLCISIIAMKELGKCFGVLQIYLPIIFSVFYFLFPKTFAENFFAVISVWLIVCMTYLVMKNENPKNIIIQFFLPMYIVIPFSFIYLLSYYGILVLLIFTTSFGTDTFAYFFGKFFGKKKLTKISPSKTVVGALGGITGGTLLSLLFWHFNGDITLLIVLAFLVITILSEIGDLAASVIKRHLNIKDYGTLIPGHGGILDRFDSVIFTAPLVYFLVEFMVSL